MTTRFTRIFAGVLALLLLTTGLALAWPDQPPERATISGPGLQGEVEITDPATLQALQLGKIEDFNRGTISAPVVGAGYSITRYFYGGKFNFAHLQYYPNPSGAVGYLYFEDGPQLSGDHTEYHQQWLYATPQGDAALRALLKRLGVSAAQAQAPNDSVAELPLGSKWRSDGLIALGSVVALGAGGVIFQRRKARGK
jgi:hypothetical protein